MQSTNRLVTLLLVLVCLMLVGMLTSSWRVVLYPYLLMVGVVLLLGIGERRNDRRLFMTLGVGVSAVYLVLYVWLDVVAGSSPGSSRDLVAGVVPSTAIYFFVIWPFGLVVAVLYGLVHRRLMSDGTAPEPALTTQNTSKEQA